jgi:hypothetical protein
MSQQRHSSNVANGLLQDALEACGAWHASTYSAPPRLVHLLVATLNSYLFGRPTRVDYRLVASSDRDARMAKGMHDIFWNSQSKFGSVPGDAFNIRRGGVALSETE